MNIIIGVGIAVGTAYLIKKCCFSGRKVEIESGQKRTQVENVLDSQGFNVKKRHIGLNTTLSDKLENTSQHIDTKTEITDTEDKERLIKLEEIWKVIKEETNNSMEAKQFIDLVAPIIDLFEKNGDTGDMNEISASTDSIAKNRAFYILCLERLDQCNLKLKNQSLSYLQHKKNIKRILDCFKKAHDIGNILCNYKQVIEASVVYFLDKIDFQNVQKDELSKFFKPYETILQNN